MAAAGATHGVIRTGHGVRARPAHVDGPRPAESAQALDHWAARRQQVAFTPASGVADPAAALAGVHRVPGRSVGIDTGSAARDAGPARRVGRTPARRVGGRRGRDRGLLPGTGASS
ncbi:hypothetical protein AQI88_37385 [Streptomyces cellostaticus]|uniref:Uncharacterized protein n=1 Tax=Streptomyces cellostaticus TaxID=67285 RepID=A0A101NDZ3_9ACTN|nr:hypothetical protein [Streptomyces cellostaticus]KUM91320.1 hypothetical protein AQI88_37385 [Streptomyces cellostaticus]GHI04484.1 hypothetical protein Scel_28050 [Streptomyces cellostaticus]